MSREPEKTGRGRDRAIEAALAGLLLVGLALALAGCGGEPLTPTPPLPPTPSPGPTASSTPELLARVTPTASPLATSAQPVTPTATLCSAPAGWVPWTVDPGETLFAIAGRYGLSAQELQAINCLPSADQIVAGQVLYVPYYVTPTPTPCAANPNWVAYTVQPGDTWYRLAGLYGLSVEELMQGSCETELYAGGTILVPYLVPTSALPVPGTTAQGPRIAQVEPSVALPTAPSPGGTPIPHCWEEHFEQETWNVGDLGAGRARYVEGQYYLQPETRGTWFAVPARQNLNDLTIKIGNMTPMGTCPDLAMGLVCRYQDNDNYVAFVLTPGGQYTIFRMDDGQATPLVGWSGEREVEITELLTDFLLLRIKVACEGQTLKLWLGDQTDPIVIVTDASIPSQGDIGLIVGTKDGAACPGGAVPEVVFDDLVVDTSAACPP